MDNELEHRLAQALKRVAPPNGLERLEQKILAKTAAQAAAVRHRKYKRWLMLAAGLLLAAAIPSYIADRNRRTERARAQLLFALQLASEKFSHAFETAVNGPQEPAHPAT